MKRITKLSTLLLSSLLVLLGFGGCKSVKKASKDENQAGKDTVNIIDVKDRPIRPDDPSRMRLLYGPPPSRYRK